jgi:hypothetical protein
MTRTPGVTEVPPFALAAYQAITNMYVQEANRILTAFNINLAFCTFAAGGSITLVLRQPAPPPPWDALTWIVPLAGLLMCLPWLAQYVQAYAYQELFVRCAREIEEHYFPPETDDHPKVNPFGRAQELAGGQATFRLLAPGLQTLSPPRWAKLISLRWAGYWIIFLFAAFFLAAITLPHLRPPMPPA